MQLLHSQPLDKVKLLLLLILITGLSVCASFAQTANENPTQRLAPGQTLEREMTGAETHRYRIDLKKDEFFQVRVEQKGVDVGLKLVDASSKVLATMDSPNGKDGPETLTWVADVAGPYLLEVAVPDPKTEKGKYAIVREATRQATAKDRRRMEVERLFAEGTARVEIKGQEESALKQLSEAENGWKELGETYLANLTAYSILAHELNREFEAAGVLFDEGRKQAAKSRNESSNARKKLTEALAGYQSLNAKLKDESLRKANSLGSMSEQALTYVKSIRFLSKQGEVLTLNQTATTLANLGEWDESITYHGLAAAAIGSAVVLLADSKYPANHKHNLLSLKAQSFEAIGGILSTYLGRPSEAVTYLTQALDQLTALYEETKDAQFKLREALALTQIGSSYIKEAHGRKKGIEFFTKAINVWRLLPNRETEIAELVSLIGTQYSADFDYQTALKNWDDAFTIYQKLDSKYGQMQILQAKGTMYYLADDKPRVQEYFNQALSILQSPDFPTNFKRSLSAMRGDSPGVFDELTDLLVQESQLDRIGFCYQMLEQYEKAIEYYEKSLVVARSRKSVSNIHGELRSIGYMYTNLKKWDKAAEYAQLSLNISRDRNISEEIADDLLDLGSDLLEQGKPEDALKYQNEALGLYQSNSMGADKSFSPLHSLILNDISRTQDTLGNRRLAIFYGKQGINAIQDERQRLQNTFNPAEQRGFLRRKEKHYRRLADWLIAEGRLVEAEQVLRMLKDEEVSDYLRTAAEQLSLRVDFTTEEQRALHGYDEKANTVSTLGVEFEKLKALEKRRIPFTTEQQARLNELQAKLTEANDAFQNFLDQLAVEFKKSRSAPVELAEDSGLQSDMREWGGGLAFVYTIEGEERSRTMLITPEAKVTGQKTIRAADLDQKILQFREQVRNPKVDPRPLGKELYDILIKPIEKELDGAKAKTLLWSLDGNLRLLPLAALWDGKEYFGQKYQNVVVTLASRSRMGREVTPNPNVLALGVSETQTVQDPLGERSLSFSGLPGVPRELAAIVQSKQSPRGVLPGESLLNASFTRKSLADELLKHFKIIHIASHFSLNAGDASRSYLVLGDGSILTVNEFNNDPSLKFDGVELLTLSACETAVSGTNSSGREVDGFAYVAQQKGAKAILASLWPVADESTSILMSEFYRLRKENPRLTKSEALQLAQKEMIEGKLKQRAGNVGGDESLDVQDRSSRPMNLGVDKAPVFATDPAKPYAHPYYWSPFILIGNWK